MTRYLVLVNPVSGRGNGEKLYPVIQSQLAAHGLAFDMVRTQGVGHAIALAREAAGSGDPAGLPRRGRPYDVVVAVGGDGTANEALNGLMQARQAGEGQAALAVIPVGRGNDFAYGIGAQMDLQAAVQALAAEHRKWIDVGFVKGGDYPQGRYFGNGVGIGFDAVVGFEALKLKRLSGFPSYIVAALKTITLYFNAPQVRIELDGQEFTQPALMVSIMNGRRLGGGFMMAPQGSIDDGVFDLCIAGQMSRPTMLGVIPRFLKGTQAGHPAIRTERSGRVIVTALTGSLPAHADGETLCTAGERLEVEILPRALEVIT